MNLYHSLTGMMAVEFTSADPEKALEVFSQENIRLFHLQKHSELSYSFTILRTDWKRLSRLCEKRGERLKVTGRMGLFWLGKAASCRPVLLGGFAVLFACALYFPSRIFFVRVEGNVTVPSRQILAAAEESGIRFGASRRKVRSEKVKNSLLSALPELQWAGVNTAGCIATVSVRERTDQKLLPEETDVCSIVAARDGYILSGTVTRGDGLFHVGQTVREGDVLISGYTDYGICIRATHAEGEIFAQTNRTLEAVTPSRWRMPVAQTGVKRKWSLLIGKKRINFGKYSGISHGSCGRIYEEFHVTLPGGFRLPLALCLETFPQYEFEEVSLLPEQAREALSAYSADYLREQMVAGSILQTVQTFTEDDGVYRMTGRYVCQEMIGRVQREQIGETNG